MTLVLLVDDDPLVADIVSATLGGAGFTVGILKDGSGALEVVECKHPALVLLDCAMPIVPGMEVLRQIRLSRTVFDVPVLMLTSRATHADRSIAMRSGATAYMCKPFEVEQLLLQVEQMIHDRRAAGAIVDAGQLRRSF